MHSKLLKFSYYRVDVKNYRIVERRILWDNTPSLFNRVQNAIVIQGITSSTDTYRLAFFL